MRKIHKKTNTLTFPFTQPREYWNVCAIQHEISANTSMMMDISDFDAISVLQHFRIKRKLKYENRINNWYFFLLYFQPLKGLQIKLNLAMSESFFFFASLLLPSVNRNFDQHLQMHTILCSFIPKKMLFTADLCNVFDWLAKNFQRKICNENFCNSKVLLDVFGILDTQQMMSYNWRTLLL